MSKVGLNEEKRRGDAKVNERTGGEEKRGEK